MREEMEMFFSMRLRDFVQKVCTIGLFISTALVCWSVGTCFTNCDANIVVVLSGSMEPGYMRGDILFLHHHPSYPPNIGDIVVYNLHGRSIPIVHRVIRVHHRDSDGRRFLLTKGDNNNVDDRGLYPDEMDWVEDDMIIGKTFAYLPIFGFITLMFNEVLLLKYVSLGLIGFFLITNQET